MRKIFLFIVLVVTLLGIPVTVYLAAQQQELRKKAAPATTLSFTPATVTAKVNEEFTLTAQIDTAENQVVAAELHVVYDPEKLEALSITNGQLFPKILGSGVIDRGTASITVGAESETKPVKGVGATAVIRFKALTTTTTPTAIRFNQNTFVGGIGEGSTNVLTGSVPANATITNTGTNPSTTPTPSLNNTTVTPTPKAATGSASLTLPPQASASAQASPSALIIVNPSEGGVSAPPQPTIQGKAAPGATVTLTIYSTPKTIVLTADANGNWTYTPDTPLEAGPHNIVATAQNPATGQVQTATISMVVAESQSAASQSATPIAGTMETTVMLVFLGMLFISTGIAIPLLRR